MTQRWSDWADFTKPQPYTFPPVKPQTDAERAEDLKRWRELGSKSK